jgi:YidC/Oxa1 family membrane protein insertase
VDRNLFLAFALSFGVLLLWTMLVEPPVPPAPTDEPAVPEAPAVVAEPSPGSPLESLPPPEAPGELPPKSQGQGEPTFEAPRPGRRIAFETEFYRAELDTRGAGIARWELTEYRSNRREGGEPIVLTTGDAPYDRALVTPFQELGFGDLAEVPFELERQEGLEFDFRYTRDDVTVRKHYRFRPDSYAFDLHVTVENGSEQEIGPRFAVTWPLATRPGNDFREQSRASARRASSAGNRIARLRSEEARSTGPG